MTRELSDAFYRDRLTMRPFMATEDGIPGYDHLVPDLSVEGARAFERRLRDLAERAAAGPGGDGPDGDGPDDNGPDAVTRRVLLSAIERELEVLAIGAVEYTVSVIAAEGASAALTMGSRTRPRTHADADAYLARCAELPRYLDAHVARLRAGADAGRTPVASLVRVAVGQVDRYLAGQGRDVLADIPLPEGWPGADRLKRLIADEVRPALARWRDAVASLPARADDECGLPYLPGGPDAYERLVRVHTTLDLTAAEIHDLGLAQVAELTDRMTALGEQLGLRGLPEVMRAFIASASGGAAEAMERAREVIRRAEAVTAELFPAPAPPPCEVAPMAEHLGETGHAPHYTPPRLDGGGAGVFWFNAQHPETGNGWGLEALAFHEAVPGHHLQLSRAQLLDHLPDLQRHGFVNAHGEGWGLYAELLAEEAGLYSGAEARLGALVLRLFRAARLVVDTGMHALGWPRSRATAWLTTTVPLPAAFADAEIARYIADPAQALSYAVGMHEILRLRDRFPGTLRDFHAAVLDNGSVPLPVLADIVQSTQVRN